MNDEIDRLENEGGPVRSIEPELTPEEVTEQQMALEESFLNEYGWPGDGSGEDDLADFNANEASDYASE